ncbi:MAG: ATP-binding protein [Chloroflexota bacterium]|nr:PAS domain S-box protein [Pseudomonadota bacterium]
MSQTKFTIRNEKYRIPTMAILVGICCLLTYYFHWVLGTEVVFSHFFYIPVILAAVWWKRKGLVVALFLALLLLVSHPPSRFGLDWNFANDLARAALLLVVGVTVSILSERMERAEARLRQHSENLERMVDERTKDLSRERDYTRHLIESSPDFQMTLDVSGKIMDVNEAFEKIMGNDRQDLIGTSIYAYLPQEEIEKVMHQVLEQGKVRDIELTCSLPERETLICSLSSTVFTTPEGEVGIYLSGRDVTGQKKRQRELREREVQMAHVSRLSSLGEMAAGMAHEINQPLTIISTAAEGILRDIRKDRFDMNLLPQDMQDVLDNVKRIDRLITHMRTFARRPEEWKYIQPGQSLDNAFVIVGGQFRLRSVSISRKIEPELPALYINPNQLEQVLINILTNARQALDERAEAAESLGERFRKQLLCRISREDDRIVFEVADNAGGLPDEIKTRIFDPFFTTKEVGQGTGLGLSIAYILVTRSLGGEIWVEDNEMGGASFKVALPIKEKAKK